MSNPLMSFSALNGTIDWKREVYVGLVRRLQMRLVVRILAYCLVALPMNAERMNAQKNIPQLVTAEPIFWRSANT